MYQVFVVRMLVFKSCVINLCLWLFEYACLLNHNTILINILASILITTLSIIMIIKALDLYIIACVSAHC